MKNILFFNIILLFTSFGWSQNMQKGFDWLETGEYAQAESFFSETLKEYPNNKTAKLCLGRAIGLNGNATKAKQIFAELLETYPNDFEIELNYAESLLWNSEYLPAKSYYENLIKKDNKSFAALLGYANTLSNLKEYNFALEYVNKALSVSKNNPNAINSKKYIYLGWSYQQLQNQQEKEAIHTLKQAQNLLPNDKDVLLNMANAFLVAKEYIKAKNTYNSILKLNHPDVFFTAKNGLALVYHLQNENKIALKTSSETLSLLNNNTPPQDIANTHERHVQCLIWNRKFKNAENYIQNLNKTYKNENWLLGLKATLYTYTANFKKTIVVYDSILVQNPTSFDGNLGKANALKALNKTQDAYKTAQKALEYFPKQKDISFFTKKIEESLLPEFNSKIAYSFDNGKSTSIYNNNTASLPISYKTKINATYNYQKANNKTTQNNSTNHLIGIGLSHQMFPNLNISGFGGIQKVKGNLNDYQQFIGKITLKTKPGKLQDLTLGYHRELQSFNADLLNKNIVQNHFYANYNLSTLFKLGWFTQIYHTQQTDDNSRNLLFTSLYYNLTDKPFIKTGVNYQYLAFTEQVPETYFSPSSFNAVEVFIELLKNKKFTKSKHLYYGLTVAFGYQYIENEKAKSAYRIQSNLGYKFNDRCYLEAYGTRSNIAAAAVDVFTYTELGLKFKWLFQKKPLFRL